MSLSFSSSARRTGWAGALLALLAALPGARACSECGCLLSSDWSAQGYPDLPGITASTRFEYYESNDLWSGTHAVDRTALEFPTDREIQQITLNRNTWFGLDYVGAKGWAASVQLPYYDRFHSTIAEGDTKLSETRVTGIGDLRLMGRYQQYSLYRSVGIEFGLKLPTGRYDQDFTTGPAAGSLLDRGLQLGTGTTDLMLGASYFRRPSAHVGWFAQLTADLPLYEREGFVPTANAALNTGIRYLNSTSVTPQLQLNVRWDSREHGAEGDVANSGGTLAYLSPGLTLETGRQSSAFVFAQLPVYRRLNGYQLEPQILLSIGVTQKL